MSPGATARCLIVAAVVAAAIPGPRTAAGCEVTVGFDGGGRRTGSWTPVVVSGRPDAPLHAGDTVHVWAEDADGQLVRSPGIAAAADGAEGASARFQVRFGRPTGRLRIECVPAGQGSGTVVEHRTAEPVASTETVVLVCGDLPGVERAVRLLGRDGGARPRILTLGRPGGRFAAGGSARDYDGTDVIVVCGSSVDGLGPAVAEGIDAWTRRGGRLVFIAGASAAVDGARSGPVAAWLPSPVERLVTLRRFAALETYARSGRLPGSEAAGGLLVPIFSRRSLPGVVEVAESATSADVPLLVRRGHGLGTIAWLGIDLDTARFRDWPGTDALLAALIGGRSAPPEPPRDEPTAGPADLAGQLRVALERDVSDPSTKPVPFEFIAAIGLAYVLCLYPLDWWLVSRGAGRPWLAWLTLPLLVAAFTAAAWGARQRRGTAAEQGRGRVADSLTTADVVDIDVESGLVRCGSWACVRSTRNGRIDPRINAVMPAVDRVEQVVSWWADAGRGFGGMDAAAAHPSLAAANYRYGSSLAALDAVPIAAAATRLFEAEWTGLAASPAVMSSLVRDRQGTLGGDITHHLPFPLEQCRLMHAGWLYDVGRLEPGQRFDPAAGRGPRSLAAALTRRVAKTDRDIVSRWNSTTGDVGRILEVAGFHAAAGGRSYTGIAPGRLVRLDLSPLLDVQRAVLVGEAPQGGTAWSVADATTTGRGIYRIVVPVDAGPAAGPAARTEER